MSRFENQHGVEHPSSDGLDVHHIIHVADGGSDHESNLLTLCRDCHKDEHRSKDGDDDGLPAEETEEGTATLEEGLICSP